MVVNIINSKQEGIKTQILELVREFYIQGNKTDYYKPGDPVRYAGRVYDEHEMINLVDSSLDFWLTGGKYTDAFEKKLAKFLEVKHCYFVNSGSSANLLAFMALTSPLLKDRAINRGDEVITVAAAFPTTVSPIVQFGAVPVFVDITIPQYNIDVSMLEKAVTNKTKAIILAHTLGNPFNLTAVKEFCQKYNLWLIEDNCDSLGSEYLYNGEMRLVGSIGDIATSSFYPPHHITTGEGGAVYTNNALLGKIVKSLRDWGRDCSCPSGVDNICRHRFEGQYGELPLGYDHKYVYSHFGYNLKPTDMQAAIGIAQLDKLNKFIALRRENFLYLYNGLKDMQNTFILPEACEQANPSWFGFLITCRKQEDRNRIVQELEKSQIQTRMLFSGNIIKHPCFQNGHLLDQGYRVVGELTNTDMVLRQSFWLGVYPGMNKQMLDYMLDKLIELAQ